MLRKILYKIIGYLIPANDDEIEQDTAIESNLEVRIPYLGSDIFGLGYQTETYSHSGDRSLL